MCPQIVRTNKDGVVIPGCHRMLATTDILILTVLIHANFLKTFIPCPGVISVLERYASSCAMLGNYHFCLSVYTEEW